MSETLADWITEAEFIEEANARGMRMTRRTLRKWRAHRLVPYATINNMILIPRDWANQLKITKTHS